MPNIPIFGGGFCPCANAAFNKEFLGKTFLQQTFDVGLEDGRIQNIAGKRPSNEVGAATPQQAADGEEGKVYPSGDVWREQALPKEHLAEYQVVNVRAVGGNKHQRAPLRRPVQLLNVGLFVDQAAVNARPN